MKRRNFLTRAAAAVAAAGATGAARVEQAVERVVEQSPRYIWHPEEQQMYERVKDGVYRVMRG